jgi:hypothetical protein
MYGLFNEHKFNFKSRSICYKSIIPKRTCFVRYNIQADGEFKTTRFQNKGFQRTTLVFQTYSYIVRRCQPYICLDTNTVPTSTLPLKFRWQQTKEQLQDIVKNFNSSRNHRKEYSYI